MREGKERDYIMEMREEKILRRFTPLECGRLQGFPDDWTDGVKGSDAARYRLWGNGMALPNCKFVFSQIQKLYERENK